MAIARVRQIDPSVARWYHCMTRCVRRAFLLEEGTTDRQKWIEDRIAELAQIFDRLAITAESRRIRLEKLRGGRLFGGFLASTRERLKQQAGRLGVRSVWNLGGCPAG